MGSGGSSRPALRTYFVGVYFTRTPVNISELSGGLLGRGGAAVRRRRCDSRRETRHGHLLEIVCKATAAPPGRGERLPWRYGLVDGRAGLAAVEDRNAQRQTCRCGGVLGARSRRRRHSLS